MNVSIITGLISAGAAIIVCLVNNHYIRVESDKKHEANVVLVTYRLEQLEKKMDIHNGLSERVYELEKKTDVMEEQIKVANHRITDIEKGA